ncbi:MAG: peptidylprolyl isomerase, partial [Hyphomicrobium sp.]
ASGVAGAKFEELGKRRPSAIQEPTRTLLLNAKDGEMLPPSMGEGGVELWIVCGRDVVTAEDQKRTQAEGELKQKEFELLAKRHLKDLRQDAHIEYR